MSHSVLRDPSSSEPGISLADEDEEERALSAEASAAVPRFGVNIATARAVLAATRALGIAKPTTLDVCTRYVLSLTSTSKQSYCEHMWAEHDAKVKKADAARKSLANATAPAGIATVFVSHAWGRPFEELVGAIEDFAARFPENRLAYFWVDTLSVNQHAVAAGAVLTAHHWARLFGRAIREMGQVCVVATPWQNPTPLTRIWCLWELFSALRRPGTTLALCMPAEERRAYDKALGSSRGLREVADAFGRVTMESAEASVPKDREMICRAVRESIGFVALDAAIRAHLVGQVLAHASASADPAAQELALELGTGGRCDPRVRQTVLHPDGSALAHSNALAHAVRAGSLAVAAAIVASPAGAIVRDCLDATAGAGRQRVLHIACLRLAAAHGEGRAEAELKGALAMVGLLLRAGARVSLGDVEGRTCLDLLPAKADAEVAAMLRAAPAALEAAGGEAVGLAIDAWLARLAEGRPVPRLGAALLPFLARAALAGGLRIGNTSARRPGERFQVCFYAQAQSGVDLSAFVQRCTMTKLAGAPFDSVLRDEIAELQRAPFERTIIMWGWFDTAFSVYFWPGCWLAPDTAAASGSARPLTHVHTIQLEERGGAQHRLFDAGAIVPVPLPPLEASEVLAAPARLSAATLAPAATIAPKRGASNGLPTAAATSKVAPRGRSSSTTSRASGARSSGSAPSKAAPARKQSTVAGRASGSTPAVAGKSTPRSASVQPSASKPPSKALASVTVSTSSSAGTQGGPPKSKSKARPTN